MPIHEKSLIREENITVQDELVIDGVDVSGHWSTFIEPRVVAMRVVHEFMHCQCDRSRVQSSFLDLSYPHRYGRGIVAR